jgi:hypothetical protein
MWIGSRQTARTRSSRRFRARGDRLDDEGGWITAIYSDERLLEVAVAIYERALVGYRQLVDRWFPTLRSQLEVATLLPMRIVGFLDPGRESGLLEPILDGYYEALPAGSTDEVDITFGRYERADSQAAFQRQRAARPHAARWLPGTSRRMSFDVGQACPVAAVVYQWLTSDLRRLGLSDTHRVSTDRGHTPWDI